MRDAAYELPNKDYLASRPLHIGGKEDQKRPLLSGLLGVASGGLGMALAPSWKMGNLRRPTGCDMVFLVRETSPDQLGVCRLTNAIISS